MTGASDDLLLSELLASRLCHELISPVGAVANGVEILEDEPDFAADAIKLIAESSRSAAQRLQFYRVAYGSGGPTADARARSVTLDLFGSGKIACVWPDTLPPLPPGFLRVACNLLLLASEALPRGGEIALAAGRSGSNETIMQVAASGAGARIAELLPVLLDGTSTADDLTPRTVHAVFTGAAARQLGATIEPRQDGADRVVFEVRLRR